MPLAHPGLDVGALQAVLVLGEQLQVDRRAQRGQLRRVLVVVVGGLPGADAAVAPVHHHRIRGVELRLARLRRVVQDVDLLQDLAGGRIDEDLEVLQRPARGERHAPHEGVAVLGVDGEIRLRLGAKPARAGGLLRDRDRAGGRNLRVRRRRDLGCAGVHGDGRRAGAVADNRHVAAQDRNAADLLLVLDDLRPLEVDRAAAHQLRAGRCGASQGVLGRRLGRRRRGSPAAGDRNRAAQRRHCGQHAHLRSRERPASHGGHVSRKPPP